MRKVGSIESFNSRILKHQMAQCGVHLDTTMGSLEENRFKKKNGDLIRKLSQELRLTYNEVESLVIIYYKYQKEAGNVTGFMTRVQMAEILHKGLDMTDYEHTGFVVYALDRTAAKNITMEAWVRSMSLFLRGSFEDKIKHCYTVYDPYNQGVISRVRMLDLMRHAIYGEGESEDVVRDLLEVIVNKMDKNRDGKISFEDYYQTVTENPLMMEVFGQCLPSRLAAHAFRTTFTYYTGKYY